MTIFDSIIILFLLLGAVLGFKKGFIKSLVSLLGIIVVIICSAYLRAPIAELLYTNLPFFKSNGLFAGLSAFNILIYETIAFFLAFSVLSIILRLVIKLSGLVEKILKLTIILGLASKILGAILGLLEMFVFIYLFLFVLLQINVTKSYVLESKLAESILAKTPVMSNIVGTTYKAFLEIYELQDDKENKEKNNLKALDILIKYNIISEKKIQELIKMKKIDVSGYNN